MSENFPKIFLGERKYIYILEITWLLLIIDGKVMFNTYVVCAIMLMSDVTRIFIKNRMLLIRRLRSLLKRNEFDNGVQ